PPQGWNQPGGQYGYGGWQAPPRPSSRTPVVVGIVIAIVVSVLIIGVVGMLGSSLGTFMEGSSLNDIAVGQCFNGGRAADSGETTIVNSVALVDCDEPHESELIASFAYAGPDSGGTYPSEADLTAYSESECSARFGQYVGVTFNESRFEMTYVFPLSTGWLIGDREMQCVVHPPLGQLTMTGSVRGARR
ncbi:MAG TPA: septum formation family protein, partial [Candidatus Limnocylindrales bacterium]|nr:septum formation family protein [Candidatus Limnocylindrales bacterium]